MSALTGGATPSSHPPPLSFAGTDVPVPVVSGRGLELLRGALGLGCVITVG